MKISFGTEKIGRYKKPVVTLGVFDGVHLAHRKILNAIILKAHSIKGTSIVLTFWPHPANKETIYSLEHRLKIIEEIGIDLCVVIRFNRPFSRISAERFVKEILVDKIKAKYVYIGKNFRFGKNAQGNSMVLKKLAEEHGFKVKVFHEIIRNGRIVSSTYIRHLIRSGELSLARRLLCRPVSIFGTVIRGLSFSGTLGFPTANIDPHHEVIPPSGIYVVKIFLKQYKLGGVCYIGNSPTINRVRGDVKRKKSIEVYIFSFKGNLYGRSLEVQFIKKIRDEKKFRSIKEMSTQIKKDVFLAKELLSSPKMHHNIYI